MNRMKISSLPVIPVVAAVFLFLGGCGGMEPDDPSLAELPEFISLSVTDLQSTSAILKATLRPGGSAVETTFEYGIAPDYGNSVPGSADPAIPNGVRAGISMVQNIFTGEKRSWAKSDATPFVRAVRAF